VTPLGTYTDSFDTTRWLASAKVEGQFTKDAWTLSPALRATYYSDDQDAYTDTLMNPIAAQTIALGELRGGPTLSYTHVNSVGDEIVPSIGVDAVWNFGIQGENTSPGVMTGVEQVRARINAELSIASMNGASAVVGAYYDGIGIDYEAYGATFRLVIPLQPH
jgi:hypothetical protein